MLLLSGIVAGLPQGWGNPATNALIASTLEPGQRGDDRDQAGRVTLAISSPVFRCRRSKESRTGRCVSRVRRGVRSVPGDGLDAPPGRRRPASACRRLQELPLSPFIYQLGFYALLMGLAGSAIGRFLPLFAEEKLGYSLAIAGFAASLSGLLGMGFRIAAARMAETRIAPSVLLVRLSSVAVSSSLLALSVPFGRWLLWPAVVLYAIGHTAWNAVANLTVIMRVDQRDAGRASGVIILGFLMGLTIAGPSTGAIVDATGRYELVWWASAALAAVSAALLALAGGRSIGSSDTPSANRIVVSCSNPWRAYNDAPGRGGFR